MPCRSTRSSIPFWRGQLLGPAAQLLLKRLACLLRLGERHGSLTQHLPFRVEALLRFGQLREPALKQPVLFRDLGRLRLQLRGMSGQPLLLAAEALLGVAQLADRGVQNGGALDDLLALGVEKLTIAIQLHALPVQLPPLLLQPLLHGLLIGALVVELLFASAHLVAQPFEARCARRRGSPAVPRWRRRAGQAG